MPRPASITRKEIETAREQLLVRIYAERDDDRFSKKVAVRQLLAQVIAARAADISFEDIAQTFADSGIKISADVLRRYYFAAKAEKDLAAEAQQHARRIARTRQMLQRQKDPAQSKHHERAQGNCFEPEARLDPAPTGRLRISAPGDQQGRNVLITWIGPT